MDIMLGWFAQDGNMARWRSENRAAISREVVELMQQAGIAHRQPQYVRYKMDYLVNRYIEAKRWLLETGMYDKFVKNRAPKEVRAHVNSVSKAFKTLDAAMEGVPLHDKSAEVIELDGDSTEDNTDEKAPGENESSSEEEYQDAIAIPLFDKDEAKENTGEKKQEKAAEKKKSPGRPRKEPKKAEPKPTEKKRGRPKKEAPKEPSEGKPPAKPKATKSPLNAAKAAAKAALQEAKQPAKPVRKAVIKSSAAVGKSTSSVTKETAKEASKSTATAPKPTTTKPSTTKTPATSAPKPATTSKSAAAATKTKSTAPAEASTKPLTAPRPTPAKRKTTDKSSNPAKRSRTEAEEETSQEEIDQLERDAAIKRVSDEEKQRREMFELERAQMECDLEAKQVKLVFEKAAARKKLIQMGVSRTEVDRILPL